MPYNELFTNLAQAALSETQANILQYSPCIWLVSS